MYRERETMGIKSGFQGLKLVTSLTFFSFSAHQILSLTGINLQRQSIIVSLHYLLEQLRTQVNLKHANFRQKQHTSVHHIEV